VKEFHAAFFLFFKGYALMESMCENEG